MSVHHSNRSTTYGLLLLVRGKHILHVYVDKYIKAITPYFRASRLVVVSKLWYSVLWGAENTVDIRI